MRIDPRNLRIPQFRRPTLHEMNMAFVTAHHAFTGVFGSVATALYVGAGLVGSTRLANGTVTPAREPDVRAVAWILAAYPVAELASTLVNRRGAQAWLELLSAVFFLSFLPVHSRLRLSSPDALWRAASIGAALACIGGALLSAFQMAWWGSAMRVEGGDGNSAVFGFVLAIMTPLALAGALDWKGGMRALLLAAAGLGAIACMFAQARGLWIALAANLALAAIHLVRRQPPEKRRRWSIRIGAGAAVLAVAVSPLVAWRIDDTVADIAAIRAGDLSGPIGERVRLWRIAADAARGNPVFGRGPDATSEVIAQATTPDDPLRISAYTHFHNAVLTALVRGGTLEAVAAIAILFGPVLIAFRRRRPLTPSHGRFIIVIVTSASVASGATGVVFSHDIVSSTLCFGYALGFALVFGSGSSGLDSRG